MIAAPVAIAILLYGGWPLAALLAVASALGAWEFFRIARASGSTPLDDVGIAIAGLIPLLVHARFLGLYDPSGRLGPLSLIVLVLLTLLALSIWARGVAGKPLGAVAVDGVRRRVHGRDAELRLRASGTTTTRPRRRRCRLAEATFRSPSGGLLLLLPVLRDVGV